MDNNLYGLDERVKICYLEGYNNSLFLKLRIKRYLMNEKNLKADLILLIIRGFLSVVFQSLFRLASYQGRRAP